MIPWEGLNDMYRGRFLEFKIQVSGLPFKVFGTFEGFKQELVHGRKEWGLIQAEKEGFWK